MSAQPTPFQPIVVQPGDASTPPAPAPVQVPVTPPEANIPQKPKSHISVSENKVIGAQITIQFRGEDGNVYESKTTVDPKEYRVQTYSLSVEEKHEKKRDGKTKDLLGFEDTGERILIFKMRYHTR